MAFNLTRAGIEKIVNGKYGWVWIAASLDEQLSNYVLSDGDTVTLPAISLKILLDGVKERILSNENII